jgi:hypothetical protein
LTLAEARIPRHIQPQHQCADPTVASQPEPHPSARRIMQSERRIGCLFGLPTKKQTQQRRLQGDACPREFHPSRVDRTPAENCQEASMSDKLPR